MGASDEPMRSAKGPNLFLRTRTLCADLKKSTEDHLTEFVAAALTTCPRLAVGYTETLLGTWGRQRGLWPLELRTVETQVTYAGRRATPDMRLTLRTTSGAEVRVLVEHKIDAAESVVQAANEEDMLTGQLERYLAIDDVAGVLYVRRLLKAPSASVLGHPRYIAPAGAPHFVWADLYPRLRETASESPLSTWLREGFEHLGFLPPNEEIGDLYDLDEPTRRRNRATFYERLGKVRTLARELGWQPAKRDQFGNEMRLEGNADSVVHRVTITGSNAGPLTIRLVPNEMTSADELLVLIAGLATPQDVPIRSGVVDGTALGTARRAVVLELPSLQVLLQDRRGESIDARLVEVVAPILRALRR